MLLLVVLSSPALICLRPSFDVRTIPRRLCRAKMTDMFPLTPEATFDQCLQHAPSICSKIEAGAFTDADYHLGPMAAFFISPNAPDTLAQLQAANEPLGPLLQREARALRFVLLQQLTMLNSFSALKRLALLQGATPPDRDVSRWRSACDSWNYGAEELEELLDKLETVIA